MRKQGGFTLIELVLVIAILGVLAVAALPNLFNITLSTARQNAEDAVVGAVQTGISLYAANQVASGNTVSYPATLDAAAAGAASKAAPLLGSVLTNGVTSKWSKISDTCYAADTSGDGAFGAGDNTYKYTPASGTFQYAAADGATCP
ncbi:MAG: hypothetical protein COV45_00115 [Deltaproteobacteria bacterium CG11_big_fil_rev_8_21_14_0_20_47_16]|nr:MAG: hypothetical protein COV45_00115 [Deltaproteobacteria bacterium CG11_big_fil_rev_8_21_14_0_20_47_16]